MASHHHPHQPHFHQNHLPFACCCGGGGGGDFTTTCFQTHRPSPHLPASSSDPLIQALASQILQSAQFHQYPTLRSQKFQSHYQFLGPQSQKKQEIPQVLHHSTVSSLLSRIEALESSLPRVFASHLPSQSLRHVAASTIQTHFRAFLVRRSRAFSELKDLAIIKSRYESLQSSFSNGLYFDRNAISLEIMDFLLHLDSIQSSDPMVKDSKKNLIRDLVQFLERIDNFAVKKRNGLPNLRSGQNVSKFRVPSNPKHKCCENQKETIEKLKNRVEKICERSRILENNVKEEEEELEESPRITIKENNQTRNRNLVKNHQILQPRVKKSVRFAENGDLSRVLGSKNPHEDYGVMDERDSSDELVEDTCNEAMEIKESSEEAEDDEEGHGDGDGESPEVSDGERNRRRKMMTGNNGVSAFTAPLPLKMENKADLMNNRKSLKILG
ncbi:BAG family molecular chaperone regulator 8 [Cucumis melo var. makuwa]|uniref:BAG family molecular chaperone regulator 8 n=2 Tax=Cucumis melo TaxID=3656 RepID=A0A5A7T904_CUCMM|nr:BAG family molecular chaperone regulator 8, chloroplastic [Cucumis melo]KAA0039443.1 BAG family molecular chaperone regulator 8 [Cucumis melo var. makuwa]TYK00632.1 BAG family molecular chaperone regulator 8 [Cucumis melo var. makuwa]